MRTVIQLGIKYPLLFQPLHAFVTRHLSRLLPSQGSTDPKRLKRTASGCYFFEGRTNGLTRDDFLQETASMLVADVVSGLHPRLVLSASKPGRIEVVTSEIWTMLKSALGYRSALALVMESKLSLCPSLSIAGHSDEDSPLAAREELFYDVKQDRAFTYDVSTGRRAWTLRVKHQVLEEGAEDQSGQDQIFQLKIVRELRGKSAPNFYYDR